MRSTPPPAATAHKHDTLTTCCSAPDMDPGERRRSSASAHGAAAAARPSWRSGALPPPPPKVYRVEPRDFRELVQRLTGADANAAGPAANLAAQQRAMTPAMVAESKRLEAAAAAAAAPEPQFDYASWYSAPLLSPAYGAAGGYGGHQGGGPLL